MVEAMVIPEFSHGLKNTAGKTPSPLSAGVFATADAHPVKTDLNCCHHPVAVLVAAATLRHCSEQVEAGLSLHK